MQAMSEMFNRNIEVYAYSTGMRALQYDTHPRHK